MTTSETTSDADAATGEPLAIVAAGGAVPLQVADGGRRRRAARPRHRARGRGGRARSKAFPYAADQMGPDRPPREAGRRARRPRGRARRLGQPAAGFPQHRLRSRHAAAICRESSKSIVGGDDTVLGNRARRSRSAADASSAPHEIAPRIGRRRGGALAGPRARRRRQADARVALAPPRAIGALDIGQAAVAVDGAWWRWRRRRAPTPCSSGSAALHAGGRFKWSGRAACSPNAPSRSRICASICRPSARAPSKAVVEAGLAGIVIEAGRVMIAERSETVTAAERSGTFILATADAERPPP